MEGHPKIGTGQSLTNGQRHRGDFAEQDETLYTSMATSYEDDISTFQDYLSFFSVGS
jgi:hypothetical protein